MTDTSCRPAISGALGSGLTRMGALLTLAAGCFGAANVAEAAVFTWANAGSDFATGTNWLGGVAPAVTGTAVFNTPAGVNPILSGPYSIATLQFNSGTGSGWVLSGSTISLSQVGTTAANSAINSAITSGTNTINAGVLLTAAAGSTQSFTQAGGGNLVVNGVVASTNAINLGIASTGTVWLNAANTYSGTTTQTAGSAIFVGNKSAFGSSTINFGSTAGRIAASTDLTGANKVTNAISFSGAGSTVTILNGSAVDFAGAVNLSGTSRLITNNNAAGTTLSGVISNDGGLGISYAGSAALNVTGTNTYTGVTTIQNTAGVVVSNLGNTGNASALGTSGTVSLGNTTTAGALRYVGGGETSNKVINLNGTTGGGTIDTTGATGAVVLTSNFAATGTGNKTLTLTGDTTGNIISGNIVNPSAGAVSVTKAGTGEWTLAGANTYTGITQVGGGTLNLDFSAGTAPQNNILSSSGTLALGSTTAASVNLNIIGKANTANVQSFSGSMPLNGVGAYHINLQPSGTGTVTLNLGTMQITRAQGMTVDLSVPTGAAVTTTTGTIAGGYIPNLTINGSDFVTLSGSNIVAFTSYVNSTGTSLGGVGQIANVATNTTLPGNATVAGLRFNDAADRTITVGQNSILTITGASGAAAAGILVTGTVGNHLSKITGGILAAMNTRDVVVMQNNTGGALEIGSSMVNNNGITGGLTKSGLGDLILSGTSSLGGTGYINEGKVIVTSDAVAGLTKTANSGSGTAVLTGVDTTGLWVGQRVSGTGLPATTYIVSIDAGSNTVTLNTNSSVTGSGITFDMSLGSAFGSGTSVQVARGASLQIGNGGASGSLLSIQSVLNNGSVIFNRSDAFTFSSTMTGAGGVQQAGSGTTNLLGTQGYTGNTVVNAGTLLVNGTALGSRAVVNSGGALGGGGTIGGITLNAGGALKPGNSIGTLSTNNGSLLWNGENTIGLTQMKFELDTLSNGADLLNLGTGILDQGTGDVFAFDFQGTGGAGFTYTLITFGSTDFTVDDFTYTNLGGGLTGEFVLNADSLQFVVSAIPEPSVAMLMAGGVALLTLRRRSRTAEQN